MFKMRSQLDIEVPQDTLKIYIDKALKLKFKALCALQDKDMSQIAVELIESWVQQNEPSSQPSSKREDDSAKQASE